jgi:hypothetical protein
LAQARELIEQRRFPAIGVAQQGDGGSFFHSTYCHNASH